ncbi:hypothetical protein OO012_14290 [Rhodobacteraceae bacterium KMM 6894]|nr:hypothetical protein [Rhodobacteraceae bacterium KMM 6894]
MPLPSCLPRHARLFELIRQQKRAQDVTKRIRTAPQLPDAALLDVARRAAASWRKMC